ncbi:hypothetical protein CIB84_004010, partial [Bambusicola thoracicus]
KLDFFPTTQHCFGLGGSSGGLPLSQSQLWAGDSSPGLLLRQQSHSFTPCTVPCGTRTFPDPDPTRVTSASPVPPCTPFPPPKVTLGIRPVQCSTAAAPSSKGTHCPFLKKEQNQCRAQT